jgi:pyruvate dehydrogenase E2 component (dihydrolipoamide acetyltransferase)
VWTIEVTREIVNADTVFVVTWRTSDGARVEIGAAVCEIDTSKAVVSIEAEQAGYVRQVAAVGAEVPVGGVLGYVTAQPDTPLPPSVVPVVEPSAASGESTDRISAKARRKIEELGLDAKLFAGRGVVREQDVVDLAAQLIAVQTVPEDPRGPFDIAPLGVIQRRVARVMESVTHVPVSYLERAVDLASVRERARSLAAASASVITELDLLVSSLACACRRHPHFNASITAEHDLRVYRDINVGVAVDVKGELFVVVLRDVARKDVSAIARGLRELQYLAQRRRAGVEHLSGGTVTVTSMLGRGVQRFSPIIFPDQIAIVGLGDPLPGTTMSALVLGFDHRAVSGSSAAVFLQDLAEDFCHPLS